MNRNFILSIIAYLLVCTASAPADLDQLETRLQQTIEDFAAFESRVVGYPGNRGAADYIVERLRAFGIPDERIQRNRFRSPAPVEEYAHLTLSDGTRFPLHGLWPNMVRTSTVRPAGIKGRLIYVGAGAWKDFDGQAVENAICLMDWNSGDNWRRAAELGALAVVFIAPDDSNRTEGEKKLAQLPVDFPRFYIDRENGQKLKNRAGTGSLSPNLQARMTWRNAETENIWALIPGRDSDNSASEPVVVLNAFYDSWSHVPAKAPGAEQSCSAAALLETARRLQANAARHSVIVHFSSAHFNYLYGANRMLDFHPPADSAASDDPEAQPWDYIALINIDLTSHGRDIGVFYQGGLHQTFYQDNKPTLDQYYLKYASAFEDFADQVRFEDDEVKPRLFNGIRPQKGLKLESFFAGKPAFDHEPASMETLTALTLTTVHDLRRYYNTSLDTTERLDLRQLARQTELIVQLLQMACDWEDLRYDGEISLVKKNVNELKVRLTTFDYTQSLIPDIPVPGAVCQLRLGAEPSSFDVRREPVLMAGGHDEGDSSVNDGSVVFRRLSVNPKVPAFSPLPEGFLLDEESGEIVMAPDAGTNGEKKWPRQWMGGGGQKQVFCVLFPCNAISIPNLYNPQLLRPFKYAYVYDRSNAEPTQYGLISNHNLPSGGARAKTADDPSRETAAVVFMRSDSATPKRNRFKLLLSNQGAAKDMALINSASSEPEEMQGVGYDGNEARRLTHTPLLAARDVMNLNGGRLARLDNGGVDSPLIERLHEQTTAAYSDALSALQDNDYSAYAKASRRALAYATRTYPTIQTTSNDVVKGVLFYLALLAPFSFFAERLFFGYSNINKRLAAVVGIFCLIFAALYLLPHPAFRISNAPYVIFMAFICLALSVLVASIVVSRFNSEMSRMRSRARGTHLADVGRLQAAGAAFSLGVSNMRRRPLRTFLTAVTLVALMFAVMSFTSVTEYMRFNRFVRPSPSPPPYSGMLIRSTIWRPMHPIKLRALKDELSGDALLASRRYVYYGEDVIPSLDIQHGERRTYAEAAIGMTPREPHITGIDRFLIAGEWFKQDPYSCVLPESIAQRLGIAPLDLDASTTVSFYGQPLKVIGILDDATLELFHDLDDEEVTPVRPTPFAIQMEKQTDESQFFFGRGAREHFPARNTIFLHADLVQQLPHRLFTIAVKYPEETDLKKKLEGLLSRRALTLFAGIGERVWAYTSMNMTGFSGMEGLLIPVALAALIVLNTMLGSLHERLREIGTYSALGLAPTHVSALFIAEAMVYAILGAIVGYLLGQGAGRMVGSAAWLAGLNLNYSSTAAVISTALVMGVVMISTVYPAIQAGRKAVPDVTRRWKLPEPAGDVWVFDFPFTVNAHEVEGLYQFLHDYFSAYDEASVGTFYTQRTALARYGSDELILSMRAWIAPFDLGVSEDIALIARPSDIEDMDQIQLRIERLSGEWISWKRVNRRFLNAIRKQFLIWRTIVPEAKAEYIERGRRHLENRSGN